MHETPEEIRRRLIGTTMRIGAVEGRIVEMHIEPDGTQVVDEFEVVRVSMTSRAFETLPENVKQALYDLAPGGW